MSFRITPQSAAEIGEVTLFTDPLEAAGLSAEELSFGQARALTAVCTDAVPPGPSRLCRSYSIPAGGAAARVGARLDGQPVLVPMRSSQPIGVYVDHDARTFTIAGGPLLGSLEVADGSEAVEIWLTLTGSFENLAPVASTGEMPLRVECIDHGRATVHLDAAASFDEDPGPGIVGYRWIEDAGLPTQRLLGATRSLDVPMSFGGDSVTLVVTDDRGALGSETVRVDVFDARLDSHQTPPDVFALRQDRRGAVVDIGEASAADGCSGTVLITNDAPAGRRFPPGASEVLWTFDDYHGNVVRAPQKVFVVGAEHYPPPIASSYAIQSAGPDGTVDVVFVYGTQGQGREAPADEHVLVRSPTGRILAADASGRLLEAGSTRRCAGASFGTTPTQGFLRLRAFAGPLDEEGRYGFAYVLRAPDGSPDKPSDVLARDDVEVDLRRR